MPSFDAILETQIVEMQGFTNHPLLSHIEDNLYVGMSPYYWPRRSSDALKDFHAIYNFFAFPKYTYDIPSNCRYTAYTCYDDVNGIESSVVRNHALDILASLSKGPTLVHCQMGVNRSNLFAAAALAEGGMKIFDAIALLREKRSPYVLGNHVFLAQLVKMYATV